VSPHTTPEVRVEFSNQPKEPTGSQEEEKNTDRMQTVKHSPCVNRSNFKSETVYLETEIASPFSAEQALIVTIPLATVTE
jgi:hypothetical protein